MMMESIVLVRCMAWKMEYCGMVSRAAGISMQPIITPMARFLPLKLNFAVAYPAITATSVPTRAETPE
mgnify:FL=1